MGAETIGQAQAQGPGTAAQQAAEGQMPDRLLIGGQDGQTRQGGAVAAAGMPGRRFAGQIEGGQEAVRELAGLWQALSPRECQVAQLAAEGLTTKAVSDVLGIAERTAQVHVAHVCSKLGVENAVGVAQIIARLRARGVLQ